MKEVEVQALDPARSDRLLEPEPARRFAPKNQPMAPPTVSVILQAAGILDARAGDLPAPVFRHLDGSPVRVVGRAAMVQDAPIPPAVPIVLQVSRWDPLKDPWASSRDSSATSPTGWARTWS